MKPDNRPKVSVVIPAYNALAFLPQAVESVLAQTFSNFEVIAVNDGSSDQTGRWLSKLTDPRVRYISQANLGQSSARNTGIANTSGEYIAFLDADDLWAPDKLERQVAYLDANPDIGLVHSSVELIDQDGKRLDKSIVAHGRGDLWRELIAYNPYYLILCGSTPMIRRVCFETVGVFDPTLQTHEDWEMWLRIARQYPFAALHEPLVFYRQHDASVSRKYGIMISSANTIIEKVYATVPPHDQHLKGRAHARVSLFAAWRAFDGRCYNEAEHFYQQALNHWPRIRYTKNSLRLRLELSRALVRQWFER